ncbi:MAG: hypothetical protein ACR2H5_21860 [Ktedonobacteraceae bacterium]
MQQVEDQIETIHLYVVREKEKNPYTFLPLFFAFLCLVGIAALTLYSGEHPSYEHETLRVPALLLPLKTFSASVHVIPTGMKTIPATNATGTLTVTNGSILSQELPKGMIFVGNGVEVVSDTLIFVPAGSASGYGVATVSAHAVTPGTKGNIAPLETDQVYGTSLYIRNLQKFTGGKESYTKTFVTPQDNQKAIEQARLVLLPHVLSGLLVHPCQEKSTAGIRLTVTWTCQFFTFEIPRLPQVKVIHTTLAGKEVLLEIEYVARGILLPK